MCGHLAHGRTGAQMSTVRCACSHVARCVQKWSTSRRACTFDLPFGLPVSILLKVQADWNDCVCSNSYEDTDKHL